MSRDPQVAWFVPICQACGWRGIPARTPEQLETQPIERCPACGAGLAAEIRKGSWRTFTRGRAAALRNAGAGR